MIPIGGALAAPPALLFEYSQAWLVSNDPAEVRLETVVESLRKFGYRSYLLGPTAMVRLDGDCWAPCFKFYF
jgi:hypothetical protein